MQRLKKLKEKYKKLKLFILADYDGYDDYEGDVEMLLTLDEHSILIRKYGDEYRSFLSLFQLDEKPDDCVRELREMYGECTEILAMDGDIRFTREEYEEAYEKNEEYKVYVDSVLVLSLGMDDYDDYYPRSYIIVGDSPEALERLALSDLISSEDEGKNPDKENRHYYLFEKNTDIHPVNKSASFILSGEPRLGKTTFSRRFKGCVIDTDAFANPLEVADHIAGNTCYVIGKWRNAMIEIDDTGYIMSYENFIDILLGNLEDTKKISMMEMPEGKGSDINIPKEDANTLSEYFNLSSMENMRNIQVKDFFSFDDMYEIKSTCGTQIVIK